MGEKTFKRDPLRIEFQRKLDALYPERDAFVDSKMRQARDFIKDIAVTASLAQKDRAPNAKEMEGQRALMMKCLEGVVERAAQDAVGEPVSGDAGRRARFYFHVLRENGTREEKEIAVNFFQDFIREKMKTLSQAQALDSVERAADMLLFLGATGAAKTLGEASEKLEKEAGRRADNAGDAASIGIVQVSPGTVSGIAELQRVAAHLRGIAEILEEAPKFVGKKPQDDFKGWQAAGH